MKKIYLLASSIAISSVVSAQLNHSFVNLGKNENRMKDPNGKEKTIAAQNSSSKAAGDVIYSQNFSAGTLGDMTTSGTDGSLWMNDLDGSNGQWSANSAMANTDASNGFAILDANYNTDNNPDHPDEYVGSLISPAIDMSSRPGGLLTFYCKYRYWGAYYQTPTVEVSTDDFNTYEQFAIGREGIRVNDGSGTYLVTLNLSQYLATATNKNNFKFRISSNSVVLYYLMVDDIKLIEPEQYDVKLKDLWLGDITTNFEHTDIPNAFASAPFTVQAHIVNNGYATPSNASLSVGIYNASGNLVGSLQSGGISANSLSQIDDTITFATTFDLSSLSLGEYTLKADLNISETDADTDNDTMSRTFNRTDFFLGQRNYEMPQYAYSPGKRYGSNDESNPMVFGNIMYVPTATSLHGLEVTIANDASYYTTTPNASISIQLYKMDYSAPSYTESFGTPLDERFFTITPQMVPASVGYNNVLFNFHQAEGAQGEFTLDGDSFYFIGVSHDGGTNHLSFGSNFYDFDYSSNYYDLDNASFYVVNKQAHTRMNFDESLSVNAIKEDVLKAHVYPNPASNTLNVSVNLKGSEDLAVKVLDMSGKEVLVSTYATMQGNNSISMDISSLTKGVYYIQLTTAEGQFTEKLVKQ